MAELWTLSWNSNAKQLGESLITWNAAEELKVPEFQGRVSEILQLSNTHLCCAREGFVGSSGCMSFEIQKLSLYT